MLVFGNRAFQKMSHLFHRNSDKSHTGSVEDDVNPEFIHDMKIPDYIFEDEVDVQAVLKTDIKIPSCPVIAFINSKSGGQLGAQLIKSYRELLSPNQVWVSIALQGSWPSPVDTNYVVIDDVAAALGLLQGSTHNKDITKYPLLLVHRSRVFNKDSREKRLIINAQS